MTRYLSGLCVAGLGLCGGGWLVVTVLVFGGIHGGQGRINLATGAGLVAVCCLTAAAWAVALRRRLRTDGVLGEQFAMVSRRQARRNRRELKRDVRHAARSAKLSAREARQRARRIPRLADGEFGGRPGRSGFGGGLTGTGPLGSGHSGGGLGEPRGWIGGGGRPGYAPHASAREATVLTRTARPGPGPAPAGPDAPGSDAAVVLGQLRNLLGPLLTTTAPQTASPPLPRREPGQERPGIPRKQASRTDGRTGWPPVGPATPRPGGPAAVKAGGPAAARSDGPAAIMAAAQAAAKADDPAAVKADDAAAVKADVPSAVEAADPPAGQAGEPSVSDEELDKLADCEEAWW